jgi:phosphatidylglycerol:prolipoprotein diacylglycerol transferase
MTALPLVITFPFSPIVFQLGPLTVRWYGVGYAVAFLVGLWLGGRYLRWRGVSERSWGDMAFWSIVIGLVCARLYYDVQSGFMWYLTHPEHILAVWEGGMAYFGAVFSVPIFLFLYSRWKKLPFWTVFDAGALFAAIGQPIGRIGNIFNGDILGYPSNLPWAVRYTNPHTLAPALGVPYQPAAAYELLAGLGILAILLLVWRLARPRGGTLFLIYLPLYALSQFFLFYLRANSVTALGLKQAQLSAIALAVIWLVLLAVWFKTREPRPVAAEPATGAPLPEGDAAVAGSEGGAGGAATGREGTASATAPGGIEVAESDGGRKGSQEPLKSEP